MSLAWGKTMVLPKDMRQPGTMLVNGMPCPTHHVVYEHEGFTVCMGQLFWSRVLGVLSSCPKSDSQHTDFNLVVVPTTGHTCTSSVRVLCC